MQITSRPYEAYLYKETDFECLYGHEIEYEGDKIEDNIQYEKGELAVFKCRPVPLWQTADAAICKARIKKALRKVTAKRVKKNIC